MFFLNNVATAMWICISERCKIHAIHPLSFSKRTWPITIKWRWIIFCHMLLICWKCEIYRSFLCLLMQIYFFKAAIYHRGMREMVMVVLWYIYSCQSVTSWDSDKINSWDVASYHLQYQGAHTPVMQAIQFYLIYPKPIQAVSQH